MNDMLHFSELGYDKVTIFYVK